MRRPLSEPIEESAELIVGEAQGVTTEQLAQLPRRDADELGSCHVRHLLPRDRRCDRIDELGFGQGLFGLRYADVGKDIPAADSNGDIIDALRDRVLALL